MEQALLFVMHAVLRSDAGIGGILRAMRHARPAGSGYALLLLCDLPDAGAATMPGDAPMLRRLQSGVMSMNARSGGGFFLLVRRRVWDDAQRAYLGENQSVSYRHVVARLISCGEADAVFDAATISPASLKGCFSHVLFSEVTLSCTPDLPARMLDALNRDPDAQPGQVLANVMNDINSFVDGAEQFDDITMLCFKYLGET